MHASKTRTDPHTCTKMTENKFDEGKRKDADKKRKK